MADYQEQFNIIADLAERLEDSDHFKTDLDQFMEYSRRLKRSLYRNSSEPEILNLLDKIGPIDLDPEKKGFLEGLLPRSSGKMWGKYQHKEKIRDQIREIADIYYRIQLLMDDGLV